MTTPWNNMSNIYNDKESQQIHDQFSKNVSQYQMKQFANVATSSLESPIATYQKTNFKYGELPKTNFSQIDNSKYEESKRQSGFFSGPNMRSIKVSDLDQESKLRQGTASVHNPLSKEHNFLNFHFNQLPDYGNPQKDTHIIPPKPAEGGWVRGGDNTRDYVRRIK